jgi:hypothetical protein
MISISIFYYTIQLCISFHIIKISHLSLLRPFLLITHNSLILIWLCFNQTWIIGLNFRHYTIIFLLSFLLFFASIQTILIPDFVPHRYLLLNHDYLSVFVQNLFFNYLWLPHFWLSWWELGFLLFSICQNLEISYVISPGKPLSKDIRR